MTREELAKQLLQNPQLRQMVAQAWQGCQMFLETFIRQLKRHMETYKQDFPAAIQTFRERVYCHVSQPMFDLLVRGAREELFPGVHEGHYRMNRTLDAMLAGHTESVVLDIVLQQCTKAHERWQQKHED